MSTYSVMNLKCGVCGHIFSSAVLASTNAFGSPDLDLRPPEMKRSTMHMWVKRCPNCGYVNADIESDGKRFADFIKTSEYVTCEENSISNDLAEAFYKYALILLKDMKKDEAYNAFLHAAWACDDADDVEEAVICREKAIGLFDCKLFNGNPEMLLRNIDLLRRAGRFSDAIQVCDSTQFEGELLTKIAQFQKSLSLKKDIGCYRVADCQRMKE